MDCVIIAGGLAGPDDPIYEYTQGKPKALLDMNGRTMLERVVDAVQGSSHIEDVVIVGLGSDMGMTFPRPVHHLPDHGSLVNNTMAGMTWLAERKPEATHVFGASADVPLLTSEMVDDLVDRCQPLDKGVYYNFVTKEVMEARFPRSNRTYVKLKGLEIAGGDIGIASTQIVAEKELLDMLSNARKHAWKIARVVGLRMMLKFLFRRVGIAEIEETVGRIAGFDAQIILNPFAEIAMDGDKPDQIELLRRELSQA